MNLLNYIPFLFLPNNFIQIKILNFKIKYFQRAPFKLYPNRTILLNLIIIFFLKQQHHSKLKTPKLTPLLVLYIKKVVKIKVLMYKYLDKYLQAVAQESRAFRKTNPVYSIFTPWEEFIDDINQVSTRFIKLCKPTIVFKKDIFWLAILFFKYNYLINQLIRFCIYAIINHQLNNKNIRRLFTIFTFLKETNYHRRENFYTFKKLYYYKINNKVYSKRL